MRDFPLDFSVIFANKRLQYYIDKAIVLVENYPSILPFSDYLNQYFIQNKKHGSQDRKWISVFCYSYFRSGKNFLQYPPAHKILWGFFLTQTLIPIAFQSSFPIFFKDNIEKEIRKKIDLLNTLKIDIGVNDFFSWKAETSYEINFPAFSLAHLLQPYVFVRIRKKGNQAIENVLKQNHIGYKKIDEQCLQLSQAIALEKLFKIDKEIIIQDSSSQAVGALVTKYLLPKNNSSAWIAWDACAASGGKTILLQDILQPKKWLLTDSRTSILKALKSRLARAGIYNYTVEKMDLTKPVTKEKPPAYFNFILIDAPCTGSGTFGRTPENLVYFEKKKIAEFQTIQQKIIQNTVPFVIQGGYLAYITCSVFKAENEVQTAFILSNYAFELIEAVYLKGYDRGANTLYIAIFRKK